MRSVRKLFYTTIALTFTSFLMKTVAVWFNVYLSGVIGSVGIGVFQLILTVYAMSKTLACGGMNLAATRLCIDDFEHCRQNQIPARQSRPDANRSRTCSWYFTQCRKFLGDVSFHPFAFQHCGNDKDLSCQCRLFIGSRRQDFCRYYRLKQ